MDIYFNIDLYLQSIVGEMNICIQNLHQCGLAVSDPDLSHNIDQNIDRLRVLKKLLATLAMKLRKELIDT
jgi:hypothetical protein